MSSQHSTTQIDHCRFLLLSSGPFYRDFSNGWLEVADNLTAHQELVDALLTGLVPETIAAAPNASAALTATMLELMNWARHAEPIVAHVVQQQQYLSCPYYLPRVKLPSAQPQCMEQVLEWLEQGACWNYIRTIWWCVLELYRTIWWCVLELYTYYMVVRAGSYTTIYYVTIGSSLLWLRVY